VRARERCVRWAQQRPERKHSFFFFFSHLTRLTTYVIVVHSVAQEKDGQDRPLERSLVVQLHRAACSGIWSVTCVCVCVAVTEEANDYTLFRGKVLEDFGGSLCVARSTRLCLCSSRSTSTPTVLDCMRDPTLPSH
jgi:hypothetical protein